VQTTVTARHCEISEPLQARAGTIADRLGALAVRPISCTVLFDVEGTESLAELRLLDARGDTLVSRGEGPDHRTALDRAEERLKRQLETAAGRQRRARRTEAAEG
jgi:ribosome-associated translation inhibitor RaiA